MAIIYSYPLVSSLDSSNLFPLTATNEEDELYVANVTFSTLASEIIDEAFNGTDRYIPRFDGTSSLVNSVIYEDTDGHVGVGVVGSPPNPVHKFEVFDLRDENPSSDYSSVVTTHVNEPWTGGGGGILSRLSTDSGATYAGQIGFVPGTAANDIVSNLKLAFHANSDMDTRAPSNLVGTVTHDDTNAHWILNGTLEETTTATLKVNGASEFTGDTTIGGALDVTGITTFNDEVNIASALKHIGDTGTQIEFTGNDTIALKTDNTTRVNVNGLTGEILLTGNVGINENSPTADLHVGGVAVVDSTLSVGGALTLNNSNVIQTDSQLDFFVGPFTDSMLQLNASPGDWSWRIGEQTSLTTITGASGSGNIDITSLGATMARFNGLTPTNSFIKLGGSGAANTLDDYEEGSFNPTFTAGSGSGTLSVDFYNLQSGNYVKVGKKVTCIIGVATNQSTVSGTAALQISGLPFTIESTDMNLLGGNLSNGSQIANVANVTAVDRGDNNTSIVFRYNNGAPSNDSFITLNISDLQGSGEYIKVLITYFTTQ